MPEQQNSDDEEVVHHFRGGMICDGAGLGKTVSVMLAAALRGPRLDAATGSSIFSGYGGTLIICPSQVVGQFQEEILRITPKARILILSTKRQHEKLTYRMLLESEYVICSDSFIVNQSHKRLLVPFNLNASDGYGAARKELGFQRNDAVSLGNKTCPLLQMVTWTRLIVDEAHLHVQRPSERTVFLSQLNAKYVWLVTGTPFQERPQTAMTEFRRYMQLLNRKRSERFVPQYELSRSRVCEFSLSEDAESNMDDSFFKTDMFENILGSLFVLHTRDSVAEEIQLPPVVRHTVFVDFTPTETALYNHVRSMNSSIAVLAETCVHPNIQTAIANLRVCKSLDEVKEAMTSGIRDELDLTVTREAAERATVDLYRKRLVDMGQEAYVLSKEAETLDLEEGEVEEDHDMMEIDADEVSQTTPLIQQQQQQNSAHVDTQHQRIMRRFLIELKLLRKSQRHIDNLQRSLNFFSTVADIKEGELCTICLCSIEGDETGNSSPMFTTCGHRFCSLCITSWIQSHGNCPICRKELTSRDVLLVASNPKSSNLAPDVLFQDHRAQFGTKIAFLLKYIMERKDQKLIVYSQYDSVLSKTTKLLRGLGIPFATCYGNIAARQKGIRDFKGDVNIILLSTQASNTGLNLTQASEVIFLDPVFRNANERIRIESQCLARLLRITQRSSQVRLTKFVVRGTIEYDEWEREQQHIS